MNALDIATQDRLRELAEEATDRDDVRAVVIYGGEKVFAAGADIKEMQTMDHAAMVARSRGAAGLLHRRGPHPQAGRRGRHRLRAGRRLRARAVRRLPDRRRQREARPAGDPARPDPGRGRHPAPVPAGRPVQGQGPDLHRPHGQGRRGADPGPGGPGGAGRRGVRRRRTPGPRSWRRGRRSRCAPPRSASTRAWRPTSTPGSRSNGTGSRACSPPRTASAACAASSKRARARRSSSEPLAVDAGLMRVPRGRFMGSLKAALSRNGDRLSRVDCPDASRHRRSDGL